MLPFYELNVILFMCSESVVALDVVYDIGYRTVQISVLSGSSLWRRGLQKRPLGISGCDGEYGD